MPDHTVAPPAKHEQSSWCLLHKHLPAQNSSLSLKDGMFRSPYAKQQQWTLQHEGKSWSIARQGIWVSREGQISRTTRTNLESQRFKLRCGPPRESRRSTSSNMCCGVGVLCTCVGPHRRAPPCFPRTVICPLLCDPPQAAVVNPLLYSTGPPSLYTLLVRTACMSMNGEHEWEVHPSHCMNGATGPPISFM